MQFAGVSHLANTATTQEPDWSSPSLCGGSPSGSRCAPARAEETADRAGAPLINRVVLPAGCCSSAGGDASGTPRNSSRGQTPHPLGSSGRHPGAAALDKRTPAGQQLETGRQSGSGSANGRPVRAAPRTVSTAGPGARGSANSCNRLPQPSPCPQSHGCRNKQPPLHRHGVKMTVVPSPHRKPAAHPAPSGTARRASQATAAGSPRRRDAPPRGRCCATSDAGGR